MKKWLEKPSYTHVKKQENRSMPKGVFTKCIKCEYTFLANSLEENLYVCDSCGYHFPLTSYQRIEQLLDKNSFEEHFESITSADPLCFNDAKGSYKDKIKQAQQKYHLGEGVVVGIGNIENREVAIGVMDFRFLGGSMGSAIGEKIYRAMQLAIDKNIAFVMVSTSGGARMHEGILSLMQMAKTCVGVQEMEEAKIPYISILANPTTGGVTASFASLGDIIIAEPGALIGFAGPRVIEQTIRQKLPKGFQTSEFLRDHGFVDMVISRNQLKEKISDTLQFLF